VFTDGDSDHAHVGAHALNVPVEVVNTLAQENHASVEAVKWKCKFFTFIL
jgi:hypothetical protein